MDAVRKLSFEIESFFPHLASWQKSDLYQTRFMYSESTQKFCWTITTSTFLHTRACDLTSEMLSRLYTHGVIVI